MQSICFLSITLQFFGLFLLNAMKIDFTISFIVPMDVPLTRHLQVSMQHQLTHTTFTPLVAHVTFWIIGYSQVLEIFPNGNLGHEWVFMLGLCFLMHPMLHWFWICAQDMFHCNFTWCMMMTSPPCLICIQQLFLHTGLNWSALPWQLHCTLNAKLGHGNLSPSLMLKRVILHRILQMLALHLQPLLLNIVREMMGILRDFVTWSHTTKNTVTKWVTFSNQGQDIEIQSNSPYLSTTHPDELQMPDNVDLDSSGLWCSTQSSVLGKQDKVYSHSTISLKKLKRSSTKVCLVLLSTFCVIGAGLTCWVHSHQVLVQSSSRLTHTINSHHRVNSLYDGTINCFSTLAQSSMALNEMFNYKQALQEPDYHDFVKAMANKVDDHESQVH